MNKKCINSTLAAVVLLAGAGAFTQKASANDPKVGNLLGKEGFDRLACYSWSNFPDERLKINIKKHSPLTSFRDERLFNDSRQWSFSVHGKDVGVCGGDTMAAVDGTVVTSEPSPFIGKGAPLPTTAILGSHLGFQINSVRVTDGTLTCAPVQVDCTSEEISPAPGTWACNSLNEFGVFAAFTLTRVDAPDARCEIFEDGIATTGAAANNSKKGSGGSGSGLRAKVNGS